MRRRVAPPVRPSGNTAAASTITEVARSNPPRTSLGRCHPEPSIDAVCHTTRPAPPAAIRPRQGAGHTMSTPSTTAMTTAECPLGNELPGFA